MSSFLKLGLAICLAAASSAGVAMADYDYIRSNSHC